MSSFLALGNYDLGAAYANLNGDDPEYVSRVCGDAMRDNYCAGFSPFAALALAIASATSRGM
jgi:hypothetical protein